MRIYLVLLTFFFLFNSESVKSQIPSIQLDRNVIDLSFSNQHIGVIIDTSKTLEIDDLKSRTEEFEIVKGNTIHSSQPQIVWLSFKLNKESDDVFRNYLIQFGNAHIAQYSLFIYDEIGLISKTSQGDNFKYSQREVRHNFFVHNLPDIQGDELTLFIKIDQEGQEVNFPINIFERNYFIQHTLRVKMFHGVVIGLFLITSLVTFVLFIVYKDKFFLYEVIVSIASILYIVSEEGYGLMLLWPDSPAMNAFSRPFFISVIVIFSLLFTLDFLKIKKPGRLFQLMSYASISILIIFLVLAHPIDVYDIRSEANIGFIISLFLFLLFLNCTLTALIALWSWLKDRSTDGMVVFLVFSATLIAVVVRLFAIQGLGTNSELVQHTGFITRGIHIPLIGGYLIYTAIANFRENQKARIQLLVEKGKLTRSLIENRDAERQRISMALHDSAGSIITGIKANLQMLQDDHSEVIQDQHYSESIKLTDQLQKEIRNISNDLLPSSITKLGLTAEIKRILRVIEETYDIKTTFESNIQESHSLDKKLTFHLYYIVREALDNIVKYSDADEILIQYFVYPDEINLVIEDNGKGFDVVEAKRKGGHGLKNMELRVTWLNGLIDIYSHEGTSITVNVPIAPA